MAAIRTPRLGLSPLGSRPEGVGLMVLVPTVAEVEPSTALDDRLAHPARDLLESAPEL